MAQLIPWLVFCLLVFVLCAVKSGAGRIFMGVFFLMMAVGINVVLVLVPPASSSRWARVRPASRYTSGSSRTWWRWPHPCSDCWQRRTRSRSRS